MSNKSTKILVLSGVGLIARYRRGVAWVFAKEDSGTVRPNAAVLTQMYLVGQDNSFEFILVVR
mgnify:FL=1